MFSSVRLKLTINKVSPTTVAASPSCKTKRLGVWVDNDFGNMMNS